MILYRKKKHIWSKLRLPEGCVMQADHSRISVRHIKSGYVILQIYANGLAMYWNDRECAEYLTELFEMNGLEAPEIHHPPCWIATAAFMPKDEGGRHEIIQT